LQRLRADPKDLEARKVFETHQADLGYGLLLLRFAKDPSLATPADIEQAAWMTVPDVPVLFWSFRIMVGLGLFFIALFATAFWHSARHSFEWHPNYLRVALWSLPLPWIAAELGWIVAEYGRQPWAIEGVLPTFLAVSTVTAHNVMLSLVGFVLFYSTLALVDAYLMVRMIRRGPEGLGFLAADPTPV
jgi:cytochrome d ubiquinol oxidase subunit I